MENLYYGLEVLVVGFTVVIITLVTLALILKGFSRIFADYDKEKTKAEPSTSAKAQQETAATVSGVEHAGGAEAVAASLGAILFTLEEESAHAYKIQEIKRPAPIRNMWLQEGRARLLNLRQEHELTKRGKYR